MRYASIRYMDISNGAGIGVALFVQGCDIIPHCEGCFNEVTWDFDKGEEFTDKTYELLKSMISKPYVKRFTLIGGEPLADENIKDVSRLLRKIYDDFPDKKIWIYTGRKFEDIMKEDTLSGRYRQGVLEHADYLVDGRYIESLRNLNLQFRGSENQRVIDLHKTFAENQIVLWQSDYHYE